MNIDFNEKKYKKSGLSLEEYLILQVLYNDPDFEITDKSTKDIVLTLEDNNWLRIIEDSIILDTNTILLFNIPYIKEAKDIVNYMNELKYSFSKRPFNFKASSKEIITRLSEGATVEEIKKMLRYKYAEWKGTEFQKYLTPDTLFHNKKFYKYLEQTEQNKDKVPQRQSKMV